MAQQAHFDNPLQQEASEQLALIESMIREGRKTTSYWGWVFVLWGVAYFIAMAWGSALVTAGTAIWAWPVTMTVTGLATGFISHWRNKGNPQTTKSRAIGGVWMAVGWGICLFAFPIILAHRFGDGHAFVGAIEILLGVANISSGFLLRWKLQTAVGLIWWTAALVTEVTQGGLYLGIAFIAATLICNIGFGSYLMVMEARDKARLRSGQVAHA
jgi:hypothetical protein